MVIIILDLNDISCIKNKNCIYCIKNTINQKMYIGSTTRELRHRLYEHFSKNSKTNNSMYRDIELYGKESFQLSLLCENIPKRLIIDLEMNFIKHFDTKNNGYNNRDADGLSEESHIRASKGQLNRIQKPFTKEHCENIRKSKIEAEYLQGKNNHSSRSVKGYNSTVSIEFDTIKDAVEYIKETQPKYKDSIPRSMSGSITRVCKNKTKTAYGYKWCYL